MRFRKTDRRALLLMVSVATVALFAGVLLERHGLSDKDVRPWERIDADSADDDGAHEVAEFDYAAADSFVRVLSGFFELD